MRIWVLGLLALLALVSAQPAVAEPGDLRSADPASGAVLQSAPERVRIAYPAPVESRFLTLEVVGDPGPLRVGSPRVEATNPAAVVVDIVGGGTGDYVVRYGALTEDGNVIGGTFVFGVRAEADPRTPTVAAPVRGPPQTGLILGKVLLLVGPVLLLGAAALRWLSLGPAWRAGGAAPPRPLAERDAARKRLEPGMVAGAPRWWRAALLGLALWLVGLPVTLVAYVSALEVPFSSTGDLLLDTRAGLALITIGAAAVVAGLGLLLVWRLAWRTPDPPTWLALAPAAAAAVALLAASWSGHASSGNDRVFGIASDALHNWAAALWLGGLLALAMFLPRARRPLADADRTSLSAAVVVRFSAIAIAAVSVLVVTGVYRALAELPSLADAFESAWGVVLVVKLAVFAVLLALGAYNRLVVHPRLERAALGLRDSEGGASRALTRSTGVEIGLGAVVMVLAAVLVVLPVPA